MSEQACNSPSTAWDSSAMMPPALRGALTLHKLAFPHGGLLPQEPPSKNTSASGGEGSSGGPAVWPRAAAGEIHSRRDRSPGPAPRAPTAAEGVHYCGADLLSAVSVAEGVLHSFSGDGSGSCAGSGQLVRISGECPTPLRGRRSHCRAQARSASVGSPVRSNPHPAARAIRTELRPAERTIRGPRGEPSSAYWAAGSARTFR